MQNDQKISTNNSRALFLLNLGTPDSPSPKDVGRYLAEFLMDPDVIDVPYLVRFLLVRGLIVPRRKYASSHAYSSIWSEAGSPLKIHTENLTSRVRDLAKQDSSKKYAHVEYAMRYGNPSVESRLVSLWEKGVRSLDVVPLYPQYAAATSLSTKKEILRVLDKHSLQMEIRFLESFSKDESFLNALVDNTRAATQGRNIQHFVLSYHGLPERQLKKAHTEAKNICLTKDCCQIEKTYCYKSQCYATSFALAKKMGWREDAYSVCFQSRLGRAKWIDPYTDQILPELLKKGIKRVSVLCPAFVSDCLETLEEIGMRAREDFLAQGGEEFVLVSCVNDSPTFAKGLYQGLEGVYQDL